MSERRVDEEVAAVSAGTAGTADAAGAGGDTSAADAGADGATSATSVTSAADAAGTADAGGVAGSADAADTVGDAALWIGMLIRQFPELIEELAPGRGARPRERERGADDRGGREGERARAAEAALLRAERQDALLVRQRHGLAVPGHSAAPLRLHVSDAIRDITDGVVELEEAVHAKLGLPLPRRAQVPERLRRIGALLDAVAAHPVLARHVRDEARRMARRCARALGDAEQIVRVPGRCPWCGSVSLRAFPARRAVLCVNPGCRCAVADCGCRDDPAYRHVWPEGEWAALGVGPAEVARFARAMEVGP